MNSRDRTAGTYSESTYNARGQNLVQGQIDSVALDEINFPYDIPNIQDGFNFFELVSVPLDQSGLIGDLPPSEEGHLVIAIPAGFYTGDELAQKITDVIGEQQVLVGQVANDAPTVDYDLVTNRFTFKAPVDGVNTPKWAIFSDYTFPSGVSPTMASSSGRDILSIMGFVPEQAVLPDPQNYVQFNSPDNATFTSNSAPLVFTQYIDVCSPQLCKFQQFSGGSTTNGGGGPLNQEAGPTPPAQLARRGELICRLYISNNIAVSGGSVEGVRPFVINRQYQNPRVMRWTAGSSIGTMDINLYDDLGRVLQYTWLPRAFQISFKVYEAKDEKETVVGSDGNMTTLPKFSAYSPQNTNAWSSPSFPMGRR
jgi:hypothetical protein